MRILEDLPQIKCDCGATLEYGSSDIWNDGMMLYVTCPRCNRNIAIEEMDSVTINNISFPESFHDFSQGKKISDERTTIWVKECLKKLENGCEDFGTYQFMSSGDTFVIVCKFEDEYEITVGKKNYTTYIDRYKEEQ